jgi:hypothetical protein
VRVIVCSRPRCVVRADPGGSAARCRAARRGGFLRQFASTLDQVQTILSVSS